MPAGCPCCPIMFISCLLSPEILSRGRINGTGRIFPQEHLTTTSVQIMSNYLWLFGRYLLIKYQWLQRKTLTCLAWGCLFLLLRCAAHLLRCVAFVNVSLQKRSSLLIVGTRLLLIAASGLLHGIWSLVVQYDADGSLLMPTSTLKYMYTCQSISNTLCYDGHYKDGTNLMVTPPSLKSSPKACSQDPLGQKGTTWNGANARVGIRGKMIMEGGRRPRAGHCNMKGWNLFQPPPGKSNRSQCHLA